MELKPPSSSSSPSPYRLQDRLSFLRYEDGTSRLPLLALGILAGGFGVGLFLAGVPLPSKSGNPGPPEAWLFFSAFAFACGVGSLLPRALTDVGNFVFNEGNRHSAEAFVGALLVLGVFLLLLFVLDKSLDEEASWLGPLRGVSLGGGVTMLTVWAAIRFGASRVVRSGR